MLNITDAIDCAFMDWAEKAIVLSSDQEVHVIHDDGTKLSQLGFSSFENSVGFLLIQPRYSHYLQRKDKVLLIELNKTVIIENITKEKGGLIRADLSFYSNDEDDTFNDFNFNDQI